MKQILFRVYDKLPSLFKDVLYILFILPRKALSALRGRTALHHLCEQDRFYLICPFGIGDIVFAVKAAQSMQLNRKICVLVRSQHNTLEGLFPGVSFIADTALCTQIENYIVLSQKFQSDRYIYCYFPKTRLFRVPHEVRSEQYSLWKDYCSVVYHISPSAVSDCAQEARSSARTVLGRYDIVLLPYAHSTKMIPFLFWQKLSSYLSAQGYTVYTNLAPHETPVAGTLPLYIPLHETTVAFEQCAACISMRSGLCDLLAACSYTKLYVLDTSEWWAPIWDVTFFRKKDIRNFLYRSVSETFQEIVQALNREDHKNAN